MDVFDLRRKLVNSYAEYIRSFIQIRDARIDAKVKEELNSGLLWPEPLIQLNPSFEPGRTVDQLVDEGILHDTCREIFRIKKTDCRQFWPATPTASTPGGSRPRCPRRRQLRPDDRDRIGKEPGVHRPDRRPRLAKRLKGRDIGDRRLSDECPG